MLIVFSHRKNNLTGYLNLYSLPHFYPRSAFTRLERPRDPSDTASRHLVSSHFFQIQNCNTNAKLLPCTCFLKTEDERSYAVMNREQQPCV